MLVIEIVFTQNEILKDALARTKKENAKEIKEVCIQYKLTMKID